MSDLRTRIAAALKAEDGKLHTCPFDGEPTLPTYEQFADAVIAELGLYLSTPNDKLKGVNDE